LLDKPAIIKFNTSSLPSGKIAFRKNSNQDWQYVDVVNSDCNPEFPKVCAFKS
jgi:hypothetical protein